MWKIEGMPNRAHDNHDWIAWLKNDAGINVKLQIGYQANLEQASEILHKFAGIVRNEQ